MPWTSALASISTWIVTLFDGNVVATGKIMRSTTNGFAVSIEAGCNGVEATLVLLAAIFAFPAPWKHKFIGLGIGILAVQLLNVLRVVSLFYLGQWNYDAFEYAHLYVWQALIMLDVLVVWLIWVRRVPRLGDSGVPPAAPPALAAG
jgi:exosortase H (IPTLxxWG-CTERM-specific)